MSGTYTSARFWKCTLQDNPDTYRKTYRGEDHGLSGEDYLAALLAACKTAGVEIIGLADHGSVQDVDTIRNHLQPQGLTTGFDLSERQGLEGLPHSGLLKKGRLPVSTSRPTTDADWNGSCGSALDRHSRPNGWRRSMPTG